MWWLRTSHARGANLGGPLLVAIKAALFFFLWPLEMSTTPRCPLLELAAVCSYITGNSCQRQSQYIILLVQVWTPVQVVLFVLRTCLVHEEASWSHWAAGSLGFTERCVCLWVSHTACWIGHLRLYFPCFFYVFYVDVFLDEDGSWYRTGSLFFYYMSHDYHWCFSPNRVSNVYIV